MGHPRHVSGVTGFACHSSYIWARKVLNNPIGKNKRTMKILQSFKQFPVVALALLSIPAWAANTSSVEAAGIPNFYQVNERIYRGGQPTDQGWDSLARLGVKTVIDLRREDEHSARGARQAVEGGGTGASDMTQYRLV